VYPDPVTDTQTLNERWGQRVEEKRKEKGMSQDGLALTARTSQQTISRIELGQQGVADDLRVRIAQALGVKPGELFTYEEEI